MENATKMDVAARASGPAVARRWTGRLAALALLAALQVAGDELVARTGWPVSGSVAGLLMLLVLLALRGQVPAGLDAVGAPLLRHLMLLLIPSVAAVGLHAGLILAEGPVFGVVSVTGTAVTVTVTAWTLRKLMRGDRT